MILGTLLLFLALAALVVGLGAALGDLVRPDPTRRHLAVRATWSAFGALLLALLVLAAAFLVGDLSIHYVWANSDLRYAWYQRLSGLWVGRAGSLLLWTAMTLGVWALEEWRHRVAVARSAHTAVLRAETAHEPGRTGDTADVPARLEAAEGVRRVARLALLTLTALMVLVVLLDDPFVPTPGDLQRIEPWGRGVNPQLIIPLNAIHPPIVFLGYALTALPAAFALGHLVTGHGGWLGPARRFAHLAFLFLTLGVGLGGLWAYIALGWGGYWAWDPVEVASLVPWLAVTVFLHAAYRADGKGAFPVAAPAFGLLTFPAAVFSTFVVRAGGVWVSLHSFLGPGAADDAWGRFLGAFLDQPEVKLYTALLVVSLLGLAVLLVRHVRRLEAAEAAEAAAPPERATAQATSSAAHPPWRRLLDTVTLQNVFVVGVLLLALLATVTITVLFIGINGFSSDRVREEVFTERTGPIALTAVLVMALAVSFGVLRKTHVLALLAGALVTGGVAALVFHDTWALAMATPVLVTVAILVATRIVTAWRTMPRRGAVRFSGIHLVHLGVAVLLLGHGFVSTFETSHPPAEFRVGETKEVGPYLLRLDALDTADTDGNGRVDEVVAHFAVWEGRDALGTVTTGFQYYDFQTHYKPKVGIEKEGVRDVYLAPSGIHDPEQGWLFGNLPLGEQGALEAGTVDGFAVQVATLPYIDLVWSGIGLMVLGAGLLAGSSWTTHRPTRTAARHDQPGAVGA